MDMTMTQGDEGSVKISGLLRLWIATEVVFGLMSVLTISLYPEQTTEQFAWPIKAFVTAALLGGFYLASASIFVLALFARRWENIRVFVPASIVFSSTELLATFLHWDKFSVGTLPFTVWFISYILPPPLFLAFYLQHQRRAPPLPRPGDEPLPATLRALMQVLGAVLVGFALVIFVVPTLWVAVAPVPFTPLTTRAFAGWVLALGLMQWLALRENDRTRVRLISPFFALALPAIALEMARYPEQIDFGNPALYLGFAVLALVCGVGITLIRGSWRAVLR